MAGRALHSSTKSESIFLQLLGGTGLHFSSWLDMINVEVRGNSYFGEF